MFNILLQKFEKKIVPRYLVSFLSSLVGIIELFRFSRLKMPNKSIKNEKKCKSVRQFHFFHIEKKKTHCSIHASDHEASVDYSVVTRREDSWVQSGQKGMVWFDSGPPCGIRHCRPLPPFLRRRHRVLARSQCRRHTC